MKKSQLLNFFRVTLLLLIFSAFTTSAWGAEAGFWSDNVIGITINGKTIYFGNNYKSHDLGTVSTAPSITGAEVRLWKNGNGNLCWDEIKLNIDGNDYSRNGNPGQDGSNYYFNIDVNTTLPAQTSTISFYAKALGNENGSDGCGNSWQTETYNIKYTIQSGSGSDDDDDDTGECKTLYLKPNVSDWSKGDERYVAYFFKNDVGHTWVNMEESSCSEIYKVAVPDIDLTSVIFVRMNGGSVINSWDTNKKWDQTEDLTFDGSNNLFTIYHKDGDKWKGSWSSNSCTDKAVCYTCSVSGSDDIYSDVKISSSNVKEIFKETFTFTKDEMKNLSTDEKDKFRKKYSVSNEKYSASIPSYDAMTTPCSAIKDGGYYAMLVNPKYAGWGDQPNGEVNCNINGHRWYRSTTDGEITEHTGDTNGGMLLFNCKNGTEDKCMPDILYECIVNDICQNTYINFSAYVACANTGIVGGNISISAEFRLLNPDENDKILAVKNIKDVNLGEDWKEISAIFNSLKASRVKIQLINKAKSGDGNDILLDDITFSIFTPEASMEALYKGNKYNSEVKCISGEKITLESKVNEDVFTGTPYYLWQKKSEDAVKWTTITEVSGVGNADYEKLEAPTETTYYRVVVANDETEAENGATDIETICGLYSVTNSIKVIPQNLKLTATQTRVICANNSTTIKLSVKNPLTTAVNDVKVKVKIPDGLTAKDGENTFISPWKISSIGAGDTSEITLTLTSSENLTAQSKDYTIVSNIASIGSDITYDIATLPTNSTLKASSTLTVNQLPTAKFKEPSSEVCINPKGTTQVEVEFTGTPNYTLKYKLGDSEYTTEPAVSSPHIIQKEISADATITLISVKDNNGCENTIANQSHEVDAISPAVITIKKPTEICAGDPLSLPTPDITYNGSTVKDGKWYLDGAEYNGADLTYKDAAYTLQYKANSSCGGAIQSNAVTFKVMDKPTINLTAEVLGELCAGTELELPNVTTKENNSTISSQGWLLETSSITSPISALSTEEHDEKTITYTATNSCGTSTVDYTTLSVKDCADFILTFGLDNSNPCFEDEVILTATIKNNGDSDLSNVILSLSGPSAQASVASSTSGTVASNYNAGVWTIPTFTSKATATLTIKFSAQASEELKIHVSESNGVPYASYAESPAKDTEELVVKEISDDVEISDNYIMCPTESSSTMFLSDFVISNQDGLKYFDKNADGTYTALTSEPTFDPSLEFASHTYYITNTETGKCESTTPTPITIEIYKPVKASISALSPICSGETSNVNITLEGTQEFTVVYNNGTADIPKKTSETTLNIAETLSSTTTYTIKSVEDKYSCKAYLTGTESATVTVNNIPSISFNPSSLTGDICAGTEIILPAVTIEKNGSSIDDYGWYLNEDKLTLSSSEYKANKNENDEVVSYTHTGKYTFSINDIGKKLVYKAKNTCGETTATFVASLNVADCADLTLVYTLDKSTYCKGDNATLTATITNGGDIDLKDVVLVQSWANLQENHDFDGKEWEIPLLTIGSSATLTITFNATVDEAFTIFVKKANDVTYGSYDVSVAKASVDLDVLEDSDPVTVNNYIACPVDNPEFPITDLVTSNKDDLKVMGKDESTGEYYALTAVPMVNPSVQTSSTTYYITNTETGKCESTTPTPVTIEIYKPVTVKITAPKEICSGDNSAVEIALDGVAPYKVVYNNGTSDIPLEKEYTSPVEINDKLTATTTYSLVSVEDNNKCKANISANDKATITVNELPTLTSLEIEDDDDYICEGSTTKLIATFTGTPDFSFNVNGIPYTSSNNTFELEISEAGDYVISALSDEKCSAAELDAESSTIHLYVEDIPEVSINPLSAELDCNTEEITLTASGANTYSWTDNKGSAAQAVASIVAQQTGSETIYTVVGTSQHGCTSDEVSVTVKENFVNPTVTLKTKLQPNGNPWPTELNCKLNSIPVVADTENSPVEIVKYEWSNGGSVNEYNDLTAKGTYTVTVTGKNGCTADAEIEITENIVKPILSVEHIGSRTEETTTILNCNDQSVNITSSVSNVSAIGGSVEYFWYKDGDEYYYGETLEVFEDGTYKIVAVGKNNCESDFTVKLTKDDTKPKAEIVASAEMVTCSTPEVNLTVKTDVDCNYFWTGIVGEDAKKQTLKVEEGGTYTVFVQSNVNGCMTTLTHTLEQHTDLPTITIASSQGKVTCIANTLTASGADSYVWSTGKTTESIEVTSGGTYTVTGTNEYGCENTAEIILEEDQVSPVIALTADTTHITCRKEIVTLTAEVTNADASRSYAYKWAQGSEDSDVTSNTFEAKAAATYKVTVTDTANACTSDETIDVNENKQTPSIETKSLDAVCLPATVDIKDAITSTNAEEVKYFADKELIQELSTTEVEAAKDAKYYVVGYEVDNNGCATEPIEIAINVKPVSAVPTVTNYDECAVEGTKTLSSLVTSDKTNLVFFADATSEEPIADEFDASAANTSATYWVSNTEANSCESERAQITIDIAGYIDFTLEASETRVPAGEEITVTLTPLTDTPVEQYIWTRNDDVISDSDETTISEQIYLTSKYAVQAVGRCNSPKQEVDIEAVWPTAFTPYNGNGKNDTFAKGMKLMVFNRFYTKIFEGEDGWDGSINGTMNSSKQTAVPGVYFYSVQLPNGEVKKGTIEIVRVD